MKKSELMLVVMANGKSVIFSPVYHMRLESQETKIVGPCIFIKKWDEEYLELKASTIMCKIVERMRGSQSRTKQRGFFSQREIARIAISVIVRNTMIIKLTRCISLFLLTVYSVQNSISCIFSRNQEFIFKYICKSFFDLK